MKNKTSNGKLLNTRLSDSEFHKLLKEAKQDPTFRKEIKEFIKITTGVYKLRDYGLENIGSE
mgnify:CR=1 FL=1